MHHRPGLDPGISILIRGVLFIQTRVLSMHENFEATLTFLKPCPSLGAFNGYNSYRAVNLNSMPRLVRTQVY